jgi:quercetin dioxygenase-like cupin family protein
MIEGNQTGAVAVSPEQMRVIEAFGDRITCCLTGRETGGKYSAFLVETPPGSGPPPHYHQREDEGFMVLEGRVEFFRDGEWLEVPPGSAVFAPQGSVHAFRNVGDTMLRQLIHTAPAGFEDFFGAMAEEWQREGGVDMGEVVRRSGEFGIVYPLMETGACAG